jgi:hypothetical protein
MVLDMPLTEPISRTGFAVTCPRPFLCGELTENPTFQERSYFIAPCHRPKKSRSTVCCDSTATPTKGTACSGYPHCRSAPRQSRLKLRSPSNWSLSQSLSVAIQKARCLGSTSIAPMLLIHFARMPRLSASCLIRRFAIRIFGDNRQFQIPSIVGSQYRAQVQLRSNSSADGRGERS